MTDAFPTEGFAHAGLRDPSTPLILVILVLLVIDSGTSLLYTTDGLDVSASARSDLSSSVWNHKRRT